MDRKGLCQYLVCRGCLLIIIPLILYALFLPALVAKRNKPEVLTVYVPEPPRWHEKLDEAMVIKPPEPRRDHLAREALHFTLIIHNELTCLDRMLQEDYMTLRSSPQKAMALKSASLAADSIRKGLFVPRHLYQVEDLRIRVRGFQLTVDMLDDVLHPDRLNLFRERCLVIAAMLDNLESVSGEINAMGPEKTMVVVDEDPP